jgi:hypothetical protein
MKLIVRTFFKTVRVILGPVMLLRERLTRPAGVVRPPAVQAQVDQDCRSLALYQYKTCPFSIKVRQEMRCQEPRGVGPGRRAGQGALPENHRSDR